MTGLIANIITVYNSLSDGALKAIRGWTGFQNCSEPSAFARFNGTDNYLVGPSFAQTVFRDEGTIVIWFIPVQLASGNVKFYDIGDGVTSSDFTTRMRIRFNGGVSTDNLRIVLADAAYNIVADVDGILEGAGAGQWRYGEPNMVYLSYYNDTVGGGPLTSKIQVGINGTLVFNDTFENAGGGDGTKQIAFNAGDNVVIGARHNLSGNFYNWDLGEIWSAPKFLEHGANMPLFMGPASTGFPNGTPVMRPTGSAVSGAMPSNHFGGFDYSIADWSNGNNGVGSTYVLNGPSLLLGDGSTDKPFTANFSKEASWIDHTDVNWYKNGDTAAEEIVAATSSTVSPAKQILYNAPVFPTPQIAGDIVELRIGAGSNYTDDSILGDEVVPSTTWADFAAISPTWNSQTDILPTGWVLRNAPHDATNFVELTSTGMRFNSTSIDVGIDFSKTFGNLGKKVVCSYEYSERVAGNIRILGAVPVTVLTEISNIPATVSVTVNNGAAPISIGRNNTPTDVTLKNYSIKLQGIPLDAQELKLVNCENSNTVVSLSNTILIDIGGGIRPFGSVSGILYGFNNAGDVLFSSVDSGDTWVQVNGITLANPVGGSGNCRNILLCLDGEVIVLRDGNLVKSIGWGTGTPTWSTKTTLSTPTGATEGQHKEWGLDFNDGIGILSEYHNEWPNLSSPTNVWITEDDGDTWNIELSTGTAQFTDLAAHWHGVCVDRFHNRFYISMGHGGQSNVYVRDFGNTTWYTVNIDAHKDLGTGPPFTSPTQLTASPRGVYLGTDTFPAGILEIDGNQPTNNQVATVIYLDEENTIMPWWVECGVYHEATGAVLFGTKLTPSAVQQPRVFGSIGGVTTLLWEFPTDPLTNNSVSIRSFSELANSRVMIVIQIGTGFWTLTADITVS